MPQLDWLCDGNGDLMVDQIYRFEILREDFDSLCKKFSLAATLPHLKASKTVDYQNYYDPETRQIIEQYFAQGLDEFNYHF